MTDDTLLLGNFSGVSFVDDVHGLAPRSIPNGKLILEGWQVDFGGGMILDNLTRDQVPEMLQAIDDAPRIIFNINVDGLRPDSLAIEELQYIIDSGQLGKVDFVTGFSMWGAR